MAVWKLPTCGQALNFLFLGENEREVGGLIAG